MQRELSLFPISIFSLTCVVKKTNKQKKNQKKKNKKQKTKKKNQKKKKKTFFSAKQVHCELKFIFVGKYNTSGIWAYDLNTNFSHTSNFQSILDLRLETGNPDQESVTFLTRDSKIVCNKLYIEDLEQKAIQTAPHPSLWWYCFIDDTCTNLKKQYAEEFTNHLNSLHPDIKFTTEGEEDRALTRPLLFRTTVVSKLRSISSQITLINTWTSNLTIPFSTS